MDREESLIHLLRVNVLKRMESSVSSFVLTIERQLADVDATLAKIEAQAEHVEEIDIEDVDIEDSAFESLLVGRKVKVLLQGRGSLPLAAGSYRRSQPASDAALCGEANKCHEGRQAHGLARGDRAQVP